MRVFSALQTKMGSRADNVLATKISYAGSVSDTEALAIMRKHCAMCHATKPTHQSFREPPKNIILETTADFKKYAAVIFAQTVQTRAMPLGNETEMTDDERAILGRWLRDLA
jgi:uncharacterized membrane protein